MTTITRFSLTTYKCLCGYILIALIIYSSLFTIAKAQNNNGSKPKLFVLIVADQFASNYLSWALNKSQANGLKRLIDSGISFTSCHYSGCTNQDATNLSVITTGAYPWSSGIIGNQWYDRRKQKVLKATAGENTAISTEENNKAPSAHALLGTTIGDELKIASGAESRIITIAASEQEAILLAGKFGDKSFWLDHSASGFTTQSRLGKDLPNWALTFNSQHGLNQYSGRTWQPLSQDALTSEIYLGSNDKNFAHTLEDNQFVASPWANQSIFEFAKESISEESLGEHSNTDMLGLCFSSFGAVCKNHGEYSAESLDQVLRFDQSLADFLQFLDKKIGINNCLIVFTACRGVGPSPEFLRAHGVDTVKLEAKNFREQLNSALSSRLGSANWIESFEPPNVYFNLNAIDQNHYHQPDIEKLAAKLGHSIAGVAEIYGAFQLFMNEVPSGPLVEAFRKSYYWGRSGELYVVPKPGCAFISENDGTSCGSPYNYDNQVPLIISGFGLRTGTYAIPADPADIAPTVANILGICSPSIAEGHVLTAKFK